MNSGTASLVLLSVMAQAEELGVISYSPLGGGLLSGKYGKAKRPDEGRLMENKMYQVRYGDKRMYEVAEELEALANEMNVDMVSLAIAWAGSHPAVTAPIIGARNVDQLRPSLDSMNINLRYTQLLVT